MKIIAIQNKENLQTFKAGKSILYSDFDGTLLAQPLHDIYNGSKEAKEKSVQGFNKYFQDFQNFIDDTKGKFSIKINTGRRIDSDPVDGFIPTLEKMIESGIKLPKIDSVITSEGGDIYHFNSDGTINPIKDAVKTEQIKKACGWDNDIINEALEETSSKFGTNYRFVNDRGSYKLSVAIDDNTKLSQFIENLQEILEPQMGIKIKSNDVEIGYRIRQKGIKIVPLINGHRIHKDFDIKYALENAIKENDFLIVAGDADNDKEALNIFRYLKNPPNGEIPSSVGEITEDYVSTVKEEIDNLPIKIMFIKPSKNCTNEKTLKLCDFMTALEKYFPKKVQIVEETKLDGENNFLNAIKCAIKDYEKENKVFAKNFNEKVTKNIFKTKIISCIIGVATRLTTISIFLKHKKLQPKNNI